MEKHTHLITRTLENVDVTLFTANKHQFAILRQCYQFGRHFRVHLNERLARGCALKQREQNLLSPLEWGLILCRYFKATNKQKATNWWNQAKRTPLDFKITADFLHVIQGDLATNRGRDDDDLQDKGYLGLANCGQSSGCWAFLYYFHDEVLSAVKHFQQMP